MTESPGRLYLILALCLVVILTGAVPALAQRESTDEKNCAATPDQLLGQAFGSFAGAEGETGANGTTPEGEDIEGEGLSADVAWIIENLSYSQAGTERVAILIVDDFSVEPTDDPEVIPSHGWLVDEVFHQLYAELPADVAANIVLEPVNIADDNGYQSDLVVTTLERAIERLAGEGIERFVINMSFVILPCTDAETGFDFADFAERRKTDPTLSIVREVSDDPEYVEALLKDNRVSLIDDVAGLTVEEEPSRGKTKDKRDREKPQGSQPEFVQEKLEVLRLFKDTKLQNDPLRDFLRTTRLLIIPIASSGNFKLAEPFYPARWNEVISVSATEGNDLDFWLHSNNGEVSVPGAWYLFDDKVYRAGTSFAAPVLSLLTAVDLTQESPTCGIQGNAPKLTDNKFENLLLTDAVAERC